MRLFLNFHIKVRDFSLYDHEFKQVGVKIEKNGEKSAIMNINLFNSLLL